ncbi:MAG: DUF2982 domain-containing protein [Psychromonas sp.]
MQFTFLFLASFIVFLSGLLKYFEPQVSFSITPDFITYTHRKGQWQLLWQDIIRIGDVKADVKGEHIQLPYVGIKLHSLENIAKNISPVLANKLLHEQQELLVLAITNNDVDVQDTFINFSPYVLNDVTYKGPVAAWLYRTEHLAKAYGYHLFLPESSLDRDINEFFSLLKQCQQYVIRNSCY